jgi:hypothetical protein
MVRPTDLKSIMSTVTKIEIPRPYPLQREIIDHPAKRKVVCAGRRAGKTVMAAVMATERFLAGQRVLLSSTSQEQADVFWSYIRNWLWPAISEYDMYKNEVRRVIQHGDAQIRVKTGHNPDALRSDHADLLILDECARLDPTAWQMVGAPMLADSDGDAVFISTPMRRNWFFELYTKGQGDDPRWASWNFSTHANPHLKPQALASLIEDMTDDAYQQEIEARFLDNAGSVFRNIDSICTGHRHEPYAGNFVIGIDWAQVTDYTVAVVLDTDRRTVVDYDRFRRMDWALQRGRIQTLFDKWRPTNIVAERNSIGSPNIEALQRDGLPVQAFDTTPSSKPPLIESLVLAFDRNEIVVLNDDVMRSELMAYERTVSSTGRSKYSAPDGMHDDTVMALALAWYGATNYSIRYLGAF